MVKCQSVGDDLLAVGIVGFELNGEVQEVHELLQYTQRCFHWRMKTEVAPRREWFVNDRALTNYTAGPFHDEDSALMTLAGILTAPRRGLLMKRGRIWAAPASRDLVVLRGRYEAQGMDVPWVDAQELDYRTMFWAGTRVPPTYIKTPELPEDLIEGHPLHDAAHQVVVLQAVYRALMLHRTAKQRRSPTRGSRPRKVTSHA